MRLSTIKISGRKYINIFDGHKKIFKNWICLNKLVFWLVTYIVFIATSLIIVKSNNPKCEPIIQEKIIYVKQLPIPVPTITPKYENNF